MLMKTKKMRRDVISVGVVFCLMGFLFAMPSLAAQKAPKGEVVIAVPEAFMMTGGDMHTSTGAPMFNFGHALYDTLVRRNPDGRLGAALAKSWDVAKDGMSIKFTLNERAKFHNGEPVTAKDVKFSYERAMRPELKFFRPGELRRNIDRIEVIDDRHLVFHFKVPFPGFLEAAAYFVAIVPQAYIEKVGDAEFAKHPIGAGPFKWVDYQQDVFANLEAVPDHYRQVPSVKKLHYKFRVDPATLMAMFKAGEADLIRVPVSNLPELKNDPKLKVAWSKFCYGWSLLFCDEAFPNEPSPFHDIRVRRAASYAINRKAICEKLLYGSSEPWGDIYSPTHLGHDPKIKPDPYDPEKAKALLKEAGYANGFDTTFSFGGGLLGERLETQAMAADLARVGIRAKLVELEGGTYIANVKEKKFRGLIRGPIPIYMGQSQPGITLEGIFSSENIWSYVVPPEIEAAWKKLSGMVDEKVIAAQAKDISRLCREATIRPLLWVSHQPWGLSQKIKSYKPIPGWMFIGGLEYLELKE
jgi:peptide/nickel transport system substrate-binding protein